MPSLGSDMEAGTLVEILRSTGENVKRGDIIAAVETQKGVIEIEVFEDGILGEWLVDLGSEVAVGAPLAIIQPDNHTVATEVSLPSAPPDLPKPEVLQPLDAQPKQVTLEEPASQIPNPHVPRPETPILEVSQPEIPQPEVSDIIDKKRLLITPSARRLAVQNKIDLNRFTHETGKTIYRADIAELVEKSDAPKPSDMRTAIAAAMSRSKREIPHFYLTHTTDLTDADAFITATNADRAPDGRLLLGALYLKAIALAVKKFPEFNGQFQDDRFHPSAAAHVGIAISLRSGGLVAPAIFNPDERSLDDVMTAMRDLIIRVRAGRFRARELTDATITLTSLGDRGVDQLYGVIYPPQVAIIGIGTPVIRPWYYGGNVAPRLTVVITLAADHRVSDGRRGAMFLQTIVKHLQSPEMM